jgi:tetratricopeptide (TPR) repeat protein
LVDARNGNQLWGAQYDRKLADLLSLQSEIARDVSQKLRVRLSGADQQKVTKNYTANTEAYQLYLKGRYHAYKLTPPETQQGISYFQQAIEIDPSYALAYVGLADAYRSLPIAGEMPSTEFLPKAKAAAQKAIDIDDTLAEAHAELGFIIFWYDWNWNAAENHYKRALELNPNSADTHQSYAHLLSSTGRHAEGLAEIKHAREIDPLNVRTNALEVQFLTHAGRSDEALAVFQKTFELDPNFWLAHLFASSAYIEKGMFAEAIAEARKARELSGASTHPIAFLGYALAKSGKQEEARAALEELLKLSTERYVSPFHIALIYNGLDERDETLAWLERGFKERDPKMVFLKVEPKWNNLRSDPRFQDLLRRVGF